MSSPVPGELVITAVGPRGPRARRWWRGSCFEFGLDCLLSGVAARIAGVA